MSFHAHKSPVFDAFEPAQLDLTSVGAPVLVIAPHPDDESIGCGGLIAALRRRAVEVRIIVVTDGTGSHPQSLAYPPAVLAAIRQKEAREAAAILGVADNAVSFWGMPDRRVPSRTGLGFSEAIFRAMAELESVGPATLVLPSRHDRHGDHRNTWEIWMNAALGSAVRPRILEYLVWPPEHAILAYRNCRELELDITAELDRKRRAIACHHSQTGGLIDDDPSGFSLPGDLIERAHRRFEPYVEALV